MSFHLCGSHLTTGLFIYIRTNIPFYHVPHSPAPHTHAFNMHTNTTNAHSPTCQDHEGHAQCMYMCTHNACTCVCTMHVHVYAQCMYVCMHNACTCVCTMHVHVYAQCIYTYMLFKCIAYASPDCAIAAMQRVGTGSRDYQSHSRAVCFRVALPVVVAN